MDKVIGQRSRSPGEKICFLGDSTDYSNLQGVQKDTDSGSIEQKGNTLGMEHDTSKRV